MNKIANNQYYKIKTDQFKNRMYLQIFGYWKTPDLIPDYVNDIKVAKNTLKPGFTLLADLRDMKTPPLILNPIHEEAQRILVTNGLSKTAEIISDIVLKTVTKRIADGSQMKKEVFSNALDAEKWLST